MLEMPGFEADCLMDWIAALGALRVLTEVAGEKDVRTVWKPAGGSWRLSADINGDPITLAAEVTAWIAKQAEAWDWASFDNVTMLPEEWAAHAAKADGLAAELWAAIGSDGCLHRSGQKIAASRLEYAQGGGHQDWLQSLRGAVQKVKDGAISADDMARVLWGRQRRADPKLICRWDWRCERDHALMASDPAKANMRQDHAMTVLAAIGLASLPTAPRHDGLSTALAATHDRDMICWPIWNRPLGLADVEALVVSQALLDQPTDVSRRLLASYGVGAVITAKRWYAGKLVVFGRGRESVRTGSGSATAHRSAQRLSA
jgi:hypothetical protein